MLKNEWYRKIIKEMVWMQCITLILTAVELYILYGKFVQSVALTIFLRLQSITIYFIVRSWFHKNKQ